MSDTIRVPLSVATRLCAELDAGENADTPETNAAERMAYSHEHMVPTEVARKLERERDEAREKYCEALTENMLHVSTIARLERDPDTDVLKHLQQSVERWMAKSNPEGWDRDKLTRALDLLEPMEKEAKRVRELLGKV